MSKKKISVENEEFNTFRALLLSIDFVKKLVIEMSDEDLNKVKENFDIAIQQRNERKENMKAIKSLMDEHGISLGGSGFSIATLIRQTLVTMMTSSDSSE